MNVRRIVRTLALAALLVALPGAASAQGRQPGNAQPGGATRAALLLGVEDNSGPAGLQLRGDLEFAQRPLSTTVGLSLVASLGYSRFHESGTDLFLDARYDATASFLRLVPAARLSLGAHPTFRPYLDGGFGLYYGWWSYEERALYFGESFRYEDSEVGLVMRLAAGFSFQVTPALAIGAELGFMPYLGDAANDTMTSALLSVSFQL